MLTLLYMSNMLSLFFGQVSRKRKGGVKNNGAKLFIGQKVFRGWSSIRPRLNMLQDLECVGFVSAYRTMAFWAMKLLFCMSVLRLES